MLNIKIRFKNLSGSTRQNKHLYLHKVWTHMIILWHHLSAVEQNTDLLWVLLFYPDITAGMRKLLHAAKYYTLDL